MNNLRVGFVRSIATGGNEVQDQGPILDSIGISNTTDNHGMTQINLQGYSSFGRAIGEIGNLDNTLHIGQELSYTRSNHNFSSVRISITAAGGI